MNPRTDDGGKRVFYIGSPPAEARPCPLGRPEGVSEFTVAGTLTAQSSPCGTSTLDELGGLLSDPAVAAQIVRAISDRTKILRRNGVAADARLLRVAELLTQAGEHRRQGVRDETACHLPTTPIDRPDKTAHDEGMSYMTRAQVATVLGVSTRTVDRLVTKGSLRTIHIGRSVRVAAHALNELLAAGRND